MDTLARIGIWLLLGFGLLFSHYVTPRVWTDLRAGLAVLWVCWLLLCMLWFIRTLVRFVMR